MVERRRIEAALLRLDPAPLHRIPVCPVAQRRDQLHVLTEQPPVVAGFPGRLFALPLLLPFPMVGVDIVPLHLMPGSGAAPQETFRKPELRQ